MEYHPIESFQSTAEWVSIKFLRAYSSPALHKW